MGILLSPGAWMLSTGTPASFGGTLACLPTGAVEVPKMLGNLSEAEMNRQLGTRYLGVLGGDILGNHETEFDLPAGRVAMRRELGTPLPGLGTPIIMTDMNLPVVLADVENKRIIPMVFDTGFRYSYLEAITVNDERVGHGTDYHPLFGRIEVELFRKKVKMGSLDCTLSFAVNPEVTRWFKKAGASGLLGWEILKHGKVAYLPARRELWL